MVGFGSFEFVAMGSEMACGACSEHWPIQQCEARTPLERPTALICLGTHHMHVDVSNPANAH